MSEMFSGRVEIGDSVLYQTVGDEIVVLNMNNQDYFGLDSVGADVWQLLLEHQNVAAVAQRVAAIYEVDEETALNDIQPLVSELLAANLLKMIPCSGFNGAE